MRCELAVMVQSTPSPLRGEIKGGLSHPLLASPVKGEVPSGGWGGDHALCPSRIRLAGDKS